MAIQHEARRITKILVAVITFRRPESLRETLDSLSEMHADVDWRLAIIDNDADQSARSIIEQVQIPLHYECEPKPGIVAARNRCLDLLLQDDDAIALLDDDEIASSGWLQALVDCAHAFNADIVAGPVLSIFPETTPGWIQKSGYHQRRIRQTGDRTGLPGTGNVLIRTTLLRDGTRFNDAFSFTGGEDTEFFMRLRDSGARMVWSADAAVSEWVAPERLSLAWIVRRFTRAGEVVARIKICSRNRIQIALEALICCTIGAALIPVSALVFKSERRRSLALFCRGRGMLRALRGSYHQEYARSRQV